MGEYSNAKAEAVINEWLHSEMDRQIMRLLLIDGTPYERIAEKLDISRITVQRHVDKCRPVIEKHLY